jgi:ATP-dependent Lhr-like helicase
MEISWPGDSGEIHTRLLEKMREILFCDQAYPYLMPNAAARLETARHLAKNTGMEHSMLVSLGGSSFCLFPWLGTRAFRTLRRLLLQNAKRFGISDLGCEGCCYMTFKAWQSDGQALLARLRDLLGAQGIDANSLVGATEMPAFDKFDPYIPAELLRRAYVADRLNPEEVIDRFLHDFAGREECC